MILMLDNYDSFTYTLVDYLKSLGREVRVVRNDGIDIPGIRALKPAMLCISPGPCSPSESGICLEAVEALMGELPILGICLGHQTIAQAFGGRIVQAIEPMHGRVSNIQHRGVGVFEGLKNPLQVTRYHSLAVERATLPDMLEITAETDAGEIMGLRHRSLPIEGVQFHPEALLTESGHTLLKHFVVRYVGTQR